jgi:transposase
MEKMPLEDMEICNSPSGMDQLLERVHTLQREHHFEKVIFSMEPTDHYWMNVATYLENRELSYVLVQPLSVRRERQSTYYRYAKTDYRDAELNGNLVADRKFTFTQLPRDGLWASLRVLAQTYVRNSLQMSADQMRIHSFLRRLYPDYSSVFKDVTKLTALSCLLSMRCLPDISSDDYLGKVRQHFKRRILPSKVLTFHELVNDPQSDWNALLYQDGLHICIAQTAERYRLLQRHQEEVEQQLLALYEQSGYAVYANTIPHLAPVFHGAVLGLTGDPALYDASRCFSKFAGVDVKDNQSGNFQGETPITHAGNGLVRYLTYLSGFILKTHEPVFKKRYQYLTEDKRPPLKKNQALIALGCKYLRILWTLCTEGVCYEERKAEKGAKKVE